MTDPEDPEAVPEDLADRLDDLSTHQLEAVRAHATALIADRRSPLATAIREDAGGRVIDVEDHGGYAVVRQRPPDQSADGVREDVVSVYHVRREPLPDGSDQLHWAYIGPDAESDAPRCPDCGTAIPRDASTCPDCGEQL